jgi:hypothetical protein
MPSLAITFGRDYVSTSLLLDRRLITLQHSVFDTPLSSGRPRARGKNLFEFDSLLLPTFREGKGCQVILVDHSVRGPALVGSSLGAQRLGQLAASLDSGQTAVKTRDARQ